jgi:antitoxin (DNA-binding transcriptional repressor) of toxin-antitoxin stability system
MSSVETIEVRDLPERAAELIRRVRDARETFELSDAGEVVARIVPAGEPPQRQLTVEEWNREADDLAELIGKHWPPGVSAVDAVREQRRDL